MNYYINLNKLPCIVSQLRHFSVNTDKSLIIDHVEHITTIGINRPEKRNCVNSELAIHLTEAINNFEKDPNSRVGVLYGVGGNFCAGFDLNEAANTSEDRHKLVGKIENGAMGPTRKFIKKPIIAAVSGYAVAGGLELAAMCDLRVVEDNAILGLFNRRFGVPLVDGGTARLTAMLGLSRALDLILTGRSLTAKQAFEWGFANRIVSCGTALGQAINLANCVGKFPQISLLADRKSAYNAAYSGAFRDLIQYEMENSREAVEKESAEGAWQFISGLGRHGKAFNTLEKDIPKWELEEDRRK